MCASVRLQQSFTFVDMSNASASAAKAKWRAHEAAKFAFHQQFVDCCDADLERQYFDTLMQRENIIKVSWSEAKPHMIKLLKNLQKTTIDPKNYLKRDARDLTKREKEKIWNLFQEAQDYPSKEAYFENITPPQSPVSNGSQNVSFGTNTRSASAQQRLVNQATQSLINDASNSYSVSSNPLINQLFQSAYGQTNNSITQSASRGLSGNPTGGKMKHQFWKESTDKQMQSSWRQEPRAAASGSHSQGQIKHKRNPGNQQLKRHLIANMMHNAKHTGAHMTCEESFAHEHDTTVKELASDLKDKLPFGLSLALRAATNNADLVKAADKIKTRDGKVDYAGVLKNVLPESVTNSMNKMSTSSRMHSSRKREKTGATMLDPQAQSMQTKQKELSHSLNVLRTKVPVWQRNRLDALRDYVMQHLDEIQSKNQPDVNIEAANLIARMGILRMAQQSDLSSRHSDTLAVYLK